MEEEEEQEESFMEAAIQTTQGRCWKI